MPDGSHFLLALIICSSFPNDSYARPVNFDEEKCISIFNNTACVYEVVEKADHSKTCEVHEWVG